MFKEERESRNGHATTAVEAAPETLWTCPQCGKQSKRARCYDCQPRADAVKSGEGAAKEFAVAAKVAKLLAGLPGPAALRVLGWVRESLESTND